MGMDGVGGSSPYQAGGMVGVGVRTLDMANQLQKSAIEALLPQSEGQTPAKAAGDPRGMLIDFYA